MCVKQISPFILTDILRFSFYIIHFIFWGKFLVPLATPLNTRKRRALNQLLAL